MTPSFSPAGSFAVGARAVLSADFDNDTVPDLALNTGEVLLGHGDGTFDSPVNSDAAYLPMAVGDLDGDGYLDLAIISTSAHDLRVYLGHGDGTLATPTNVNVTDPNGPEYLESVAIGDFNGDGLLDLSVTSSIFIYDGDDPDYGPYGHYEGYAKVLAGTGGGAFSGPNTTALGDGHLRKSAVADFNGDGIDDLATVDIQSSAVRVLLGDTGGFLQGPTFLDYSFPLSLALADVDGDLDADLVMGQNGIWTGLVSVLPGDGAGGFGSPHPYQFPGSADVSVAVADFNGDGKLDIATTSWEATGTPSPTSYIGVLLGHGDGTFASPITQVLAAGPVATALVADDFDGDGLPDVAVLRVKSWGPVAGPQVDVLLNDGAWSPDAQPSMSIGDASVTEGNTGTVNATFTLTLSRASNVDVTVHYDTADITATAGSDYTSSSGTVIIPAGWTSATFTVAVKGDRLAEPNETFAVNLSAATNATLGDAQGIGTIVDNEPRISISDVTKAEGRRGKTTLFTFTVTLSAPYDQPVTMSFRTVNGTAKTSDNDYVAKTGTLTFVPGQTTKTITITVKGDSKKEANETFYLDLFGNSGNSLLTKDRGLGTILNDD